MLRLIHLKSNEKMNTERNPKVHIMNQERLSVDRIPTIYIYIYILVHIQIRNISRFFLLRLLSLLIQSSLFYKWLAVYNIRLAISGVYNVYDTKYCSKG